MARRSKAESQALLAKVGALESADTLVKEREEKKERSRARKRDKVIGGLSQKHKDAISAAIIEQRLIKHALGEIELSPTQVRALEALLDRRKPKLSAVDMQAQVKQSYTDALQRVVAAREGNVIPFTAAHHADNGEDEAEQVA